MLPKDGSAPVDDANNKRKMKEVMEEPSSTQHQRLTMPMNFFPLQPHLQQLRPSLQVSSPLQFNFNSQQQQPTEPDNLDKFLTKPFTSFTALLTEEDDDYVPVPVQSRFLQTRVRTLERRSTVQDTVIRLYAAGATREDHGDRSEAQQQNQEDAESSFVDPNRKEPANMGPCRACFVADAAAIILPCRHLCVCAPCAAAVNACPVCQTPKLTTYEVLLP